jgi:hypothetical protein
MKQRMTERVPTAWYATRRQGEKALIETFNTAGGRQIDHHPGTTAENSLLYGTWVTETAHI